MCEEEKSVNELSEEKITPVIPLREMCVMPNSIVHFDLSRKKSIASLERAMSLEQDIFLVAQKDAQKSEPDFESLYHVGTYAKIKQVIKMPNKLIRVLVEGSRRGRLLSFVSGECYMGEISFVQENPDAADVCVDAKQSEAMKRQILQMFQGYAAALQKNDKGIVKHLSGIPELSDLLDQMTVQLPIPFEKKQCVLETFSVRDRFSLLAGILQEEMEIAGIRNELASEIKKRVDKNQKDYMLREQMKYIRQELGEDPTESDADLFRARLQELEAEEEIKTKINKEIRRFEQLAASSSESAVERAYVETLLEMPWDKASVDNTDLDKAEVLLDDEHYGMDKVKERILEYLAVRQLCEKGNTPILCLVGPPGTGKTSIAKSMAKAMNREYVRICLGGVRDEAEIRGHRKTYVGAMPGRIAVAVKQAGVRNPLILLDEIDKMSRDFKGDTASAMLEVLDSEQNAHFQDHYIEIPIDLSDVVFVATANDIQQIDGPLRDRMEIIEVNSYTANEKMHIAREHLIKKQLKAHGLRKKQLTITDKALDKMISGYTKEAGVRELERQIGKICRKAAREILKDGDTGIKVSGRNLESYLGKEKYREDSVNQNAEIGIVRGLAWTSVGGVTLEIEVNDMPGKGEVKLTGQLGDVMKESAMTAVSYVRFVSEQYHVAPDYFEKHDLHIHIPEGAVPKDGPSAGITMTTAVLSAVTRTKVHADVAMTGEVTLRGRVLPIGGLKEKLLAAKMAGMKKVLIPKDNERDLAEIDEEIKTGLNIVPVERMDDVIKWSFDTREENEAGKKRIKG